MEYPTPSIISWAEALGIRYGEDYNPRCTDFVQLLEMIEGVLPGQPNEVLAKLTPLGKEAREIPAELRSRAKDVQDAGIIARYALDGIVQDAVVKLRDRRKYRIVRLSARGNSCLEDVETNNQRLVVPSTLRRGKAVKAVSH
jgi:hypothetical protein